MTNMVYDYFIAPVGAPTSENATALLQEMKLEALDAEIVWLKLGPRKSVPSWSISKEVMWHVHRSPRYSRGVHYQFYRKNRASGAVTLVPREKFSDIKSSPAYKQMRRDLASHVERTNELLKELKALRRAKAT